MTRPSSVAFIAIVTALGTVACGGSSSPTAPSPTSQSLSVQAIRATPEGVGVQYSTEFQFDATGTLPTGTQFVWQFGDGTSTTTSTPRSTHIYAQTGSFGVTVEARSGSSSASAAKSVSVRSLVGRWIGTVTGHTYYPANRPIPIPRFELVVSGVVPPAPGAAYAVLAASWADDAGCRENRVGFINQGITPQATATVVFGVESLLCNDRSDFYMTGLADAAFNRVEGSCATFGGPNCKFHMVRQ